MLRLLFSILTWEVQPMWLCIFSRSSLGTQVSYTVLCQTESTELRLRCMSCTFAVSTGDSQFLLCKLVDSSWISSTLAVGRQGSQDGFPDSLLPPRPLCPGPLHCSPNQHLLSPWTFSCNWRLEAILAECRGTLELSRNTRVKNVEPAWTRVSTRPSELQNVTDMADIFV